MKDSASGSRPVPGERPRRLLEPEGTGEKASGTTRQESKVESKNVGHHHRTDSTSLEFSLFPVEATIISLLPHCLCVSTVWERRLNQHKGLQTVSRLSIICLKE